MSNPKIVYTPSTGSDITLEFSFPPRQSPAYHKVATRHDNISTTGIRECVLERVDDFLDLTVEWIPAGDELDNWRTFLDYALAGGPFAYYPDASQSSFTNYVLEDTEARLEYRAPGMYSLALKLRTLVT